jgi:hypothetical protein
VLSGEAYPMFVGKLYEGVRGEISREYYCSAYCMVKWAGEFFTDGGLLAVDSFRGLVTNQIAASVFAEAPWHDLGDVMRPSRRLRQGCAWDRFWGLVQRRVGGQIERYRGERLVARRIGR